jgi:hypothetical protein
MRARMRASHRSVLASLPAALSEASGLTGIDLDPRQAGRVEGVLEETVIGPRRLEHDSGDVEPFELFDQGAMALRVVRDTEAFAGGWTATSRASFEMSTPTLCVIVDLIFSQSSSCLGGMIPECPFRPLGKERGGQTTNQSFRIAALATGLCGDRPAATNPAGSDGKIIRQAARDSPS